MIIYPEKGEYNEFLKTAHKLVSVTMKVPLKKFPNIFYGKPKEVAKKYLIGESLLFEKAFYNPKKGHIFINKEETKDKELGFSLGEEIFHFIHHYYNPKSKNDAISEYFGYMGRFLLHNLFRMFNYEKFLKFFKENNKVKNCFRELKYLKEDKEMLEYIDKVISPVLALNNKIFNKLTGNKINNDELLNFEKRMTVYDDLREIINDKNLEIFDELLNKDFNEFLKYFNIKKSDKNLKELFNKSENPKYFLREWGSYYKKLFEYYGKRESLLISLVSISDPHYKGYWLSQRAIYLHPVLDMVLLKTKKFFKSTPEEINKLCKKQRKVIWKKPKKFIKKMKKIHSRISKKL